MSATISPPPQPPTQSTAELDTSPEMPPDAVVPASPAPDAAPGGAVVGGLILIALGLVFLAGNVFQVTGGLLFLGLGAAFLMARVVTGRYGYAVPAGILLGLGAFVALTESGIVNGPDAGGAFFVLLGLGFLASYLIGGRPSAVWPIIPAAALIGFGIFVQGLTTGWAIPIFAWLADYGPLALVLIGVWILVRNQIPAQARTVVAVVGAGALVLIAFLAAAASVAQVRPVAGLWQGPPFQPIPWFGGRVQDTVVLNAPVTRGDVVHLTTTSGNTIVRVTSGPEMRVEAIRHYWPASQPPDVRLVPTGDGVSIESSNLPLTSVDYIVEVPTDAGATLRSTSGNIEVSGLAGPVLAQSTSGDIRGSRLTQLRQATTTSGNIDLAGTLASDALVQSTSGDVVLRLAPESAVRLDARTNSGAIRANSLALADRRADAHFLAGTLGSGREQLTVRTTSGDIFLTNQP